MISKVNIYSYNGVERKMKKLLISALVACGAMQAFGAYYIAGDFQGWDPGSTQLTETSSGSGIYSIDLSNLTSGKHEFKITVGSWAVNWPAANSWLFADSTGNITVSFNTNLVSDGWLTEQYRIGLNYVPSMAWSVAGGFNGWNNNDDATMMTDLGGGKYYYELNLAAGEQNFKPVIKGSWDSISIDNRSVGTSNITMNLAAPTKVGLWVDTLGGTVKYGAVPEPATMIALGAGLAALAARRRRK